MRGSHWKEWQQYMPAALSNGIFFHYSKVTVKPEAVK